MKKKNVVTIGGGSGQYVLLRGLRDLSGTAITAIVSMADNGGSTGRLRDQYGILPPGDIAKCILALSPEETHRDLLQKRFNGHRKLHGHTMVNLLLTMLSQRCDSFPKAVLAFGKSLKIKGTVFPVTIDKTTLVAELTDGTMIFGEAAIDVPRGNQREKIRRTFLVPHHNGEVKIYPPVIKAIRKADFIIIGPGDLYTSITPNFLVSGVKEAMKTTQAKILYVVNIMTKFGETDGFNGRDFILKLEEYVGRKVDAVIFNLTVPGIKLLKKYEKQKAYPVNSDGLEDSWEGRKIVKEDLLSAFTA